MGEEPIIAAPQPYDGDLKSPCGTGVEVVARTPFAPPTFERVYAETFPAAWRMVRRMGVADTSVDDVVQEAFVAVYRNLFRFNGASTVKTWVLGVTMGVVRNYRRAWRRKRAGCALATVVEDPDLIPAAALDPHQHLTRAEAGRLVQQVLNGMNEEKASLFILVEIEGLTAVEVAQGLGLNVQTIYSRLASARREFERGLLRAQLGSRTLP